MEICIILVGNIVDGFKFVGPFEGFDAANDHARRWIRDDYSIVFLETPSKI